MNDQNTLLNQLLAEDDEFSKTLTAMPEALPNMMMEQLRSFLEDMVGFKELEMMYVCAIKEVRTKIDVLNTEFNIRYRRNPISYISTRLKTTSSIMEKLLRRNIPISLSNIEQYLNDVAGIRIICAYIDDIYSLADALSRQTDITVLEAKDYIKNPKPNGYRSLHLILSLPVFFANQKKDMKVEVQIRTTAMDYWAGLEHQLKYKKQVPDQEQIVCKLKQCADVLAETDREMLDLRKKIESAADAPDRDDILLEKLKHLDRPIL